MSDPNARACFVGIGPGTSRGMMCRAVLEGICYAVRSLMPLLPPDPASHTPHHLLLPNLLAAIANGEYHGEGSYAFGDSLIDTTLPTIFLVGGVANSATLARSLASVLKREVAVPNAPSHAAALGAADLAAVAIAAAESRAEPQPLSAQAQQLRSARERLAAAVSQGSSQSATSTRFLPNPNLFATYDAGYERFRKLHPSLEGNFQ